MRIFETGYPEDTNPDRDTKITVPTDLDPDTLNFLDIRICPTHDQNLSKLV